MSMLLRRRTWKGALAILCGLCMTAGVTAAVTSGAETVFKVDHQLCYTAVGKFKPPTAVPVRLINQFSPNGFVPKINPGLVVHCNPVIKTVVTPAGPKTYPVTNPHAHLGCFPITESQQKTWKVMVTNQFGQAVMTTGQPNLLCLPTWKSLTGPPMQKPTTPPGLNHFTCYPVTLVPGSGAYKAPAVILRDEFGKAQSQVSSVPKELCLPTTKIVGKREFPIIDAKTHLLCFPGVKHPFRPAVYDENQFGTSKVAIRIATWLCLPSTKQVIGPAG